MNAWFRFYHEALDDPKVQKLSPKTFKFWINLLCLAARNEGVLPSNSDISFSLRLTEDKTSALLSDLESRRLLDRKDGRYVPHEWDKRQFKSDGSTERVQRFRERHGNVSETLHETGPEQSRPEQIQNRTEKIPPAPEKRAGKPDLAYEHFAIEHRKMTGAAYVGKRGDFVRLAELRKANGIESKLTPDKWEDAVRNYFGSPLAQYTLADLCMKFPVFRNSSVDEYRKPVNHGGNNGHKTKTAINLEAAQRLRARWDAEDIGSDERDAE